MTRFAPDLPISQHFDPFVRERLVRAAAEHDLGAIDEITIELARGGLCRSHADQSMFPSVATRVSYRDSEAAERHSPHKVAA